MALIRDGEWVLFSSDIKRGRHTWRRQNPDGSWTFRTDYVCDPTIEANTAMRNMLDPGWKGDYHKVASVPLNIYWDKLAPALQQDDERFVSKFLNDSDNAAWRSKEGRV